MLKEIHSTEDYLIHLIEKVINNGQPQEKPSSLAWKDVYELAKKHQVANLSCYGVDKLKEKPEAPLWAEWKDKQQQNIVKDIIYTKQLQEICEKLSENGIRCLPLKGSILKFLYPRPDMRMMADLDVLIDEENAAKAKKVFLDMGFEDRGEEEEIHDVYFKAPLVNLELHRRLFLHSLENFSNYYNNGMEHAMPSKDNPMILEMSKEEFYAYYLAHLNKHYEKGGSGIRSFLDIYLMQKAYGPQWDEAKLAEILRKLGLTDFERQARELALYWYGDGELTESCKKNIPYVMGSGVYGSVENLVANRYKEFEGKRGGKLRYLLSRLFPPAIKLCDRYPILRKHGYLLPLVWIHRFIWAGKKKRKKISGELQTLKKNK